MNKPMDDAHLEAAHQRTKRRLRMIGLPMLVIGGCCLLIGTGEFFLMDRFPRYFFLNFVGMPLVFFGAVLTLHSYAREMIRYSAAEAAPVQKDVINYMAAGTQGAVKTLATAVGSGLREGMHGAAGTGAGAEQACTQCGAEQPADAKFCDQCGTPLAAQKLCQACNAVNDADARFCCGCGAGLTARSAG